MSTPVVIVGAGGHGRELLDLIGAVNRPVPCFELLGYLDDGDPDLQLLHRLGVRHLGSLRCLETLPPNVEYLLGLGSGVLRRQIDGTIRAWGRHAITLVHPTAVMGSDMQVGEGVVVCAQASVTSHVTLGRHVHVNVASTVAHDVVLEDYVTLSPGSRVSGNVVVEAGTTIGTGAMVLPGLRIGPDAVIGAGAVVTQDVAAGLTVAGVPARPLR